MNNLENKIVQYIKMKIQGRYEGNILILVILIMLTVAMMGLLTMSFLKQMFAYTINLDGYYKSYYLSKAGIELALTEIDNSDVGFSNEITGANNIFTQNLCGGLDCAVTLNIRGKSNILSEAFWDGNCNEPIVLSGGESFALPLFLQSEGYSNADILEGIAKEHNDFIVSSFKDIFVEIADNSESVNLNLSLVFSDLNSQLEHLYIASQLFESLMFQKFYSVAGVSNIHENEKLYLMISNPNENAVSFCLKSDNIEMPATKFYVVSLGNYQGRYVGMQAIYAQPIPSFMFYGYNEHGSAIIKNN